MGHRIRTLKPEHKANPQVGLLSDRAYRLWVGLITEADDEGRFHAEPGRLQATVFPYQRALPLEKVEAALLEVAAAGLIGLFDVEAAPYGYFPSWQEHQKVGHPTPSRIPRPDGPFTRPHETSGNFMKSHEDSRLIRSDPIRSDPNRSDPIGGEPRGEPVNGHGVVFKIPERIEVALAKCPLLTTIPKLHDPAWWQRQLRAHVGVDFAVQLTKAESWIASNPKKRPRKDVPGFLWRWFAKAAADVEAEG